MKPTGHVRAFAGEPILSLLVSKLRLSGWALYLLFSAIMLGGMLLVCSFYPTTPTENGPVVSFYRDISTFIDFALLNPLVIALIVTFLTRFASTISASQDHGVVDITTEDASQELTRFNSRFARHFSWILAAIVTAVAMYAHINSTLLINNYFAVSNGKLTVPGIYMMAMTSVYLYLLIYFLFRLALILKVSRKIFSGQLKVDLMHEDKCGGLGQVGAVGMILNLILFLLAVTALLFFYTDFMIFHAEHSFRSFVMIPAYLIATPIIFFYPLAPLHASMQRRKEELLQLTRIRFNDIFARYRNIIATYEEGDMAKDVAQEKRAMVEEMSDLRTIFKWVDDLPSWPFNIGMTLRFSLSMILPLLAYVVQFADAIKSWFQGGP
jgi:hypothetical protein